MGKPLLLDLFCGAGGCTKGYQLAGFRVVGIDNNSKPLRHYVGDGYICMDALEAMKLLIDGEGITFSNGETLCLIDFALIHASPPCQGYSKLASMHPRRSWDMLIEPTRDALKRSGVPYVIESVETAPLAKKPDMWGNYGVILCGSMFGLKIERGYLRRHRLFETSFPVPQLCCRHNKGRAVGVYGHGGNTTKHRMLYRQEASEIMKIDWMSRDNMAQAIPPCYTCFIGGYLLSAVLGGEHRHGDSAHEHKCDTCDAHHLSIRNLHKNALADSALCEPVSQSACPASEDCFHDLILPQGAKD